MKNKKVVELDERIPTFKERRRQRANRRLILYISVFFLLMTIVMYFQSSFSHVKTVEVEGNEYISTNWIITNSELIPEVSMWRINEEAIIEKLTRPEIASLEINRRWPNTVIINLSEYERIGYLASEGTYFPLLETGHILSEIDHVVSAPHDAPLLFDFHDEDSKKEIAKELSLMPISLRERISEIYHAPVENDASRLVLFMNDGFVVHSTIRRFSERLAPYPSVVEQLEPGEEGIVHMRMNPYFESTKVEEEEEGESEG
ncbi:MULTISPECIES: cell division protein FtsQ/DivIB [Bacillaceae]|uniref:Cell division protein DivIB n=1 Tax=Evansella alkalicola TaxID=745819 RepID=A0ABS6JPE9_9BACI|nr:MULTISPECIES: FtsQ-type POTRA domain-containing protein [Bacillaceae]MBU9720439.1 FtsQ-type POTRA domain-containing protein [Bacillus alkalicola]